MPEFERITVDPAIMGGKPCIRGIHVTVGTIVEAIAAGRSVGDVVADFPDLETEDIKEALLYAAWLVQERDVQIDG